MSHILNSALIFAHSAEWKHKLNFVALLFCSFYEPREPINRIVKFIFPTPRFDTREITLKLSFNSSFIVTSFGVYMVSVRDVARYLMSSIGIFLDSLATLHTDVTHTNSSWQRCSVGPFSHCYLPFRHVCLHLMHAVSSVMTLEDCFDAIKDDKTVMKFLGGFFCSKSLKVTV